MAVLNEAQRRFVLTEYAQGTPSCLILNDLREFYGATDVKEADITRFRKRNFLNPFDRDIYDKAAAEWETSSERLKWTNKLRHVAALGKLMDDIVDRKSVPEFLQISREIREIMGDAEGEGNGSGTVTKITRTIVHPAPREEPK